MSQLPTVTVSQVLPCRRSLLSSGENAVTKRPSRPAVARPMPVSIPRSHDAFGPSRLFHARTIGWIGADLFHGQGVAAQAEAGAAQHQEEEQTSGFHDRFTNDAFCRTQQPDGS